MRTQVDWSKRADYVRARHAVQPSWADEAVGDAHAVWIVPDPASRSGYAIRIIGYSDTAATIITVILLDPAADPEEQPDGDWWGSNAWLANARERREYGRNDDEQDR